MWKPISFVTRLGHRATSAIPLTIGWKKLVALRAKNLKLVYKTNPIPITHVFHTGKYLDSKSSPMCYFEALTQIHILNEICQLWNLRAPGTGFRRTAKFMLTPIPDFDLGFMSRLKFASKLFIIFDPTKRVSLAPIACTPNQSGPDQGPGQMRYFGLQRSRGLVRQVVQLHRSDFAREY